MCRVARALCLRRRSSTGGADQAGEGLPQLVEAQAAVGVGVEGAEGVADGGSELGAGRARAGVIRGARFLVAGFCAPRWHAQEWARHRLEMKSSAISC